MIDLTTEKHRMVCVRCEHPRADHTSPDDACSAGLPGTDRNGPRCSCPGFLGEATWRCPKCESLRRYIAPARTLDGVREGCTPPICVVCARAIEARSAAKRAPSRKPTAAALERLQTAWRAVRERDVLPDHVLECRDCDAAIAYCPGCGARAAESIRPRIATGLGLLERLRPKHGPASEVPDGVVAYRDGRTLSQHAIAATELQQAAFLRLESCLSGWSPELERAADELEGSITELLTVLQGVRERLGRA